MHSQRLKLDTVAIETEERADRYMCIRELAWLLLTNPDVFDQVTVTFFMRRAHGDADSGVAGQARETTSNCWTFWTTPLTTGQLDQTAWTSTCTPWGVALFVVGGRASAAETLTKAGSGDCSCLPRLPGIGRANMAGGTTMMWIFSS